MQIAQILAGYSLGEADLLRRAMGKKKKEEMDQQRARFISGAAERGVPAEPGRRASSNWWPSSPATASTRATPRAYALIAYQTAWLKANAPVEFFAASMSLDLVQHRQAVGLLPGRQALRREDPGARRQPSRGADFEVEDGEVLYALGAVRNVGLRGHAPCGRRARGGRAVPRPLRLRRAGRPAARSTSAPSRPWPGPGPSTPSTPTAPRSSPPPTSSIAHAQSVAADRASAQVSLFGGDQAEASRPRLPKIEPWTPIQQLDEELAAVGFYLSGHPLDDMVEVLRRRRTDLLADAMAKAEAGAEAFRMAGVVRRRQERASAPGEKFAFVTLSDPTGEYEVLFPPESLAPLPRLPGAGPAVVDHACGPRPGTARFASSATDAEPVDKAVENAVGGPARPRRAAHRPRSRR